MLARGYSEILNTLLIEKDRGTHEGAFVVGMQGMNIISELFKVFNQSTKYSNYVGVTFCLHGD